MHLRTVLAIKKEEFLGKAVDILLVGDTQPTSSSREISHGCLSNNLPHAHSAIFWVKVLMAMSKGSASVVSTAD